MAVTAIDDTPVVANDPVLSADELRLVNTYTTISGLGTVTAAARTTDGLALYVSDDKGAIALFQRDANSGELTYVRTFAAAEGVTGISQLQVSADGNSVYALRADGNAIVWFSRDAEGNLEHKETIIDNYDIHKSNLYGIKGITLSDDGKTLYVINNYNLLWFTRDTATGKLDYAGLIEGNMTSPPYLWAPTSILSRGNLLFVTTNPSNGATVIVYQARRQRQTDAVGTCPRLYRRRRQYRTTLWTGTDNGQRRWPQRLCRQRGADRCFLAGYRHGNLYAPCSHRGRRHGERYRPFCGCASAVCNERRWCAHSLCVER
nr:beta-propeller fold lactonase family protein [Pectobacterium colocasium]